MTLEDGGYYDRINENLLNWVPRNANSVLELGCGTGALGARFKSFQPNCEYWGIELHGDAVERARTRLDKVIEGNIENDATWTQLEGQRFDAFVMGDVLEHLLDPWSTLSRLRRHAHDRSTAVVCIPNVQNWTVLRALFQGQWPYADEGLFDQTHLRFFTLQSALDMIKKSGWSPLEVHNESNTEGGKAAAFVRALQPALAAQGLDPHRAMQGLLAYQYWIRATAQPLSRTRLRLSSVAAKLPNEEGLANVRMHQPLKAEASLPGVLLNDGGGLTPEPSKLMRDILVLQRPIIEPETQLESYRQVIENGSIVVVEFDDDPEFFGRLKETDYLTFRAAHAIQTSTAALKTILTEWNPNIAVFPNAIDQVPDVKVLKKSENPVRFFFGAFNREADWAPWIDDINEVLTELGDQVAAVVVHDAQFFDRLTVSNKSFQPLVPYQTYRDIVRSCHVAWLPLSDTRFNRCKSDLKFLECAALGTAILASPVVYGQSVQDGVTGLIYRDREDFRTKLRMLLTYAERRASIAKSAYEYVRNERMVGAQVEARRDWHISLVDNQARLERERRDRLRERFPDWAEGSWLRA